MRPKRDAYYPLNPHHPDATPKPQLIEGANPAGVGKSYVQTFTRLGEHGSPRHPYGSFAGKSPAPAGGNLTTHLPLLGVG